MDLRDATGRGGNGLVPKVGVKDSYCEVGELLKVGARGEGGLACAIE